MIFHKVMLNILYNLKIFYFYLFFPDLLVMLLLLSLEEINNLQHHYDRKCFYLRHVHDEELMEEVHFSKECGRSTSLTMHADHQFCALEYRY